MSRIDVRTRSRLIPSRPLVVVARRVRDVAPWPVLAVISAGGVLGALARHGLDSAIASQPGRFPWGVFTVNVSGCLLIGVLMVLSTDLWPGRRLIRPFLGTGVLGGYTTFSTYVVDIQQLVAVGAARTALAYLAGTVTAALSAVYVGSRLAHLAIHRHAKGSR